MDASGAVQIIAAIFGPAGVAGATLGLARAYRASLDRAREEGRAKLLQEQAAETITTLKAEIVELKAENGKLWALVGDRPS